MSLVCPPSSPTQQRDHALSILQVAHLLDYTSLLERSCTTLAFADCSHPFVRLPFHEPSHLVTGTLLSTADAGHCLHRQADGARVTAHFETVGGVCVCVCVCVWGGGGGGGGGSPCGGPPSSPPQQRVHAPSIIQATASRKLCPSATHHTWPQARFPALLTEESKQLVNLISLLLIQAIASIAKLTALESRRTCKCNSPLVGGPGGSPFQLVSTAQGPTQRVAKLTCWSQPSGKEEVRAIAVEFEDGQEALAGRRVPDASVQEVMTFILHR